MDFEYFTIDFYGKISNPSSKYQTLKFLMMRNNFYRENRSMAARESFSTLKMVIALIIIAILFAVLFPIGLLAQKKTGCYKSSVQNAVIEANALKVSSIYAYSTSDK